MRAVLFLAIFAITCFSAGGLVWAHPHAWISVKTTLVVNDKGEVVAIREHWLFDKMYTAYALRDLKPHGAGRLTEKDMQAIAEENVANLKDYSYFTVFEDGAGKRVAFGKATAIRAMLENPPPQKKSKIVTYATAKGDEEAKGSNVAQQMAMEFTVPLAVPVNLTSTMAVYRIYDPTYYTEITHDEQTPVLFVKANDGAVVKGCEAKVQLPKVDQAMVFSAAALDKSATAPDDLGYVFSEKVSLSCAAWKP